MAGENRQSESSQCSQCHLYKRVFSPPSCTHFLHHRSIPKISNDTVKSLQIFYTFVDSLAAHCLCRQTSSTTLQTFTFYILHLAIMSAIPLEATFRGFVGTTVDAAILVQAVIWGKLRPVNHHPTRHGHRYLAHSGNVIVYGPRVQRWRDSLSWTPRRALGHGFDVYRETTKKVEAQMDADQIVCFPLFSDLLFVLAC